MLGLFQRERGLRKFPILETSVQMLDNQAVENIFYRELQRNCASFNYDRLMAPELRAGSRIHMSGTGNEGLAS